MTMSQVEIERKLRQVDSDVQSIYQMLSAVAGTQTRHGNRFQKQAEKLDTLEAKVDAIDTKVGSLDTTLGPLDKTVGSLDTRLGSLDTTVGSLDTKLDTVLTLLRGR